MSDKSDVTGRFEPPPPNAPREVAQPIDPAVLRQQAERAQQNEQALRPLTFDQPGESKYIPPAEQTAVQVSAAKNLARTIQLAHEQRTRTAQPAASDSDSPSRGMPKPVTDPGKQVTGGFGAALEAQYFPLNGQEVLKLVEHLCAELIARSQNDLHFHLAATYPRLRAVLTFHLEGYGVVPVDLTTRPRVHEKTPTEVAAAHGADPVSFEVETRREEFTPEGESVNPPDRIRDELGLPKPQKQAIETPGGRMLVDIPELF